MLSKWHVHAEGYARELLKTEKVEITAVWDEKPERGAEWAERLGCDFEADLDKLLARSDVDAVCCNAPTTMHTDVLIRAAKAGKHIFTEKTLACTVAECREIEKAVNESGVTFVISFPNKAWPVVKFAKEHIENGDFGRVTNVRIRNAHNGVSGKWLPEYWFVKEDCAGGAMMDLGCHPMYLLAYLCGKPVKVTGIANSVLGTPVDENAISVIEFENGAIGVSETGFVSECNPYTLEISGTDGAVMVHGDTVRWGGKATEGKWVELTQPEKIQVPIDQWIDAVCDGGTTPFTIEDAVMLTRLMDGAYKSYESGVKFVF